MKRIRNPPIATGSIDRLLVVGAFLLSMACTLMLPNQVAGPVLSGNESTPIASGHIEAPAGTVTFSGTTNSDGEMTVEDRDSGVRVQIRTENALDARPVQDVLVYWGSYEDEFVAVAVDRHGRYLPAAREGSYSDLPVAGRGLQLASFNPNPSRQAELVLVLILVEAIDKINSLVSLGEYFADWPDIVNHATFGGWYSEYCMTGEQLANLIDGAGVLVPGARALGADAGIAALDAIVRHNAGEAVESRLTSLEGRHGFRLYTTPFPVPFFTYEGRCDGETATIAATATANEYESLLGTWQGEVSGSVDGNAESQMLIVKIIDNCESTVVCVLFPDVPEPGPYPFVGGDRAGYCFGDGYNVYCFSPSPEDSLRYQGHGPLWAAEGILRRTRSNIPETGPASPLDLANIESVVEWFSWALRTGDMTIMDALFAEDDDISYGTGMAMDGGREEIEMGIFLGWMAERLPSQPGCVGYSSSGSSAMIWTTPWDPEWPWAVQPPPNGERSSSELTFSVHSQGGQLSWSAYFTPSHLVLEVPSVQHRPCPFFGPSGEEVSLDRFVGVWRGVLTFTGDYEGAPTIASDWEVQVSDDNCEDAILCMSLLPCGGTDCPRWLSATSVAETEVCFGYSGEESYCLELLPDGKLLFQDMEGMDAGSAVFSKVEES